MSDLEQTTLQHIESGLLPKEMMLLIHTRCDEVCAHRIQSMAGRMGPCQWILVIFGMHTAASPNYTP